MRRILTWSMPLAALVIGCLVAKNVQADGRQKAEKAEAPQEAAAAAATAEQPEAVEAPEFIKFEKVAKMPPVNFPHKKHAEKLGGCKDCHDGEKPLFARKRGETGMKMADIYAGKGCGSCHDGKDHGKSKKVFAAKTGCMKCHKAEKKK